MKREKEVRAKQGTMPLMWQLADEQKMFIDF